MSEVKKWYIGVYGGEAQARPCSPAQFEIIRDRDRRYFVVEDDFDRVTAERDAALGREAALLEDLQTRTADLLECGTRRKELQQRLTAADERADLLSDLLLRTLSYYTESCFPEDLLLEVKSALKVIP